MNVLFISPYLPGLGLHTGAGENVEKRGQTLM